MKNVTIKVNRPDGSSIKNWEKAKFVGFSKKINSGLGACVIDLAEKFDYSGNDLNLNNDIEILITGREDKEKKLCDSYSESNSDNETTYVRYGAPYKGQSFTAVAGNLDSCKFYLKKKNASTAGNLYAKLYAHTGTFGADGVPTGSALATSDAIAVSSLSTSIGLITFSFTGANIYSLTSGTKYCIVFYYDTTDTVDNYVYIGLDTSSPSHGGNLVNSNDGSSWSAFSAYDVCFYVYYVDKAKEAKLIYKGYISSYEPWADGKKEGIKVNLLGYYTLLGQDIWKNGTTTTFDYSAAATDIGTVFKALMTRYLAETTSPKLIKGQIDLTSTTTQFIFEMLTYREGIDILRSLAPTNWFWYVDQYNQVKFKLKPTTATHSFIFTKHFKNVKIVKSMEKIKNAVLLYADNQNLLNLYTDAGSIADYGRRIQKFMVDRGLTTDCDKIAQAFVAENKDPNIRIEVEILDNSEDDNYGYDIESIDPGDTCSFFGFNEGAADMMKENMLITEVKYFLDKAVIIIEPLDVGVIKRSENINERVDALEREGVNATYVT